MKNKLQKLLAVTLSFSMLVPISTYAVSTMYESGYSHINISESQFSIANVDTLTTLNGANNYNIAGNTVITTQVDLEEFTIYPVNSSYVKNGDALSMSQETYSCHIYDGTKNYNLYGQTLAQIETYQNNSTYTVSNLSLESGSSISISTNGTYCITARYPSYNDTITAYITLTTASSSGYTTAIYSTWDFSVADEDVSIEAYSIGGNNYLKLRDIAYVVSGTSKQFNATWDNDSQSVLLTSSSPYTIIGGEMSVNTDKSSKITTLTKHTIYIDGELFEATVYVIEGNNYFKLRDICSAFDIGIDWDNDARTVSLNTSKSYSDD